MASARSGDGRHGMRRGGGGSSQVVRVRNDTARSGSAWLKISYLRRLGDKPSDIRLFFITVGSR